MIARVLIGLLLVPGLARADEPLATPAAIDVDRGGAPPGRVELGFDSGAIVDGWGVGLALGYLDQPIVLRAGGDDFFPVERRQTLALGGALALGPSAVVDARWSVARQTGDRLLVFGTPRALDRYVPRDLVVGGRVRVVGAPRGAAFVRAELSLPTGDARDFAGEPSWTLGWSLIGRAFLPRGIVVAGTAGIRLRGDEVLIADRLISDELFGGLGVVVPLPPLRPLWCGPDQVAVTAEVVGILGNDVAGARGPSPAEVRFGVIGRPRPAIAIGVRVGAGLADEIGAPRWRGTVEVAFQPARR